MPVRKNAAFFSRLGVAGIGGGIAAAACGLGLAPLAAVVAALHLVVKLVNTYDRERR